MADWTNRTETITENIQFEEINQTEMTELLNTLKRHQGKLMTYRGVHKVDVGFRWKGEKMTREIALRAYVKKKQLKKDLDSKDIVPEDIDGFPVDVIQSNITQGDPITASETTDRGLNPYKSDPLMGGVETWNVAIRDIGTLGAIVYDRQTGQQMALSNFHVFVKNQPQDAVGNIITQPCTGGNADDIIGKVVKSDSTLDCSIAQLTTKRQISTSLEGISGGIKGIVAPTLGMQVMKSGRATGITYGMIDGVGADNDNTFTIVPIPNKWDKKEISSGGDSGSIWIEQSSHAAVGLHFGGETSTALKDERAWAKSIQYVAHKLDIDVFRKAILPTTSDNSVVITALNGNFLLCYTESNSHQLNFVTSSNGFNFQKINALRNGIPMIEKSFVTPALTVFNNTFFVAWIDNASNNIQIMRSADGVNWSDKDILDVQSASTPTLCTFKNQLLMAWRDLGNNKLTIMRSTEGSKWTNKCVLGAISDFSPTIAVLGKTLYIAWRDVNSPQINIMQSTNGQSFTNKIALGETSSAHSPFLVANSKTLFLAWRSMNDNRLNILESNDGTVWKNKITLRETCIGCPTLIPINVSAKIPYTLVVWAWTKADAPQTVQTMVYDFI